MQIQPNNCFGRNYKFHPNSRLQFYGCLPAGFSPPSPANDLCSRGGEIGQDISATVDSSDPRQYRHFAVNEDTGSLYFCDQDQRDPRGLKCYQITREGHVTGKLIDCSNLWAKQRVMK